MKYYKLFLVFAILALIVLFFWPRTLTHAQTPLFDEAPQASSRVMILQYAASYKINGQLALAIAECESQLVSGAHNSVSSAKGIYQFLDSSWKVYSLSKWGEIKDVLSAKDNIELGVWVLSKEGTTPWTSSERCWS